MSLKTVLSLGPSISVIDWLVCAALNRKPREDLVFSGFLCLGAYPFFFVMADIGFALTASHLEERQVTKRSCPFRSVAR